MGQRARSIGVEASLGSTPVARSHGHVQLQATYRAADAPLWLRRPSGSGPGAWSPGHVQL